MTKEDMMAQIVWENDRRGSVLNNSVKEVHHDDPMKDVNWFIGAAVLLIVLILLGAFLISPAEAKQKSNLTRLEQCQVDYYFCAGRIVQQQAAYNAAALMTHTCSNDTTPVAQYLDLVSLPKFEVASVCQAHLGACGYYLAHWDSVLKAKYAEVRAICK